nr:MAG TPA_asm: hypothetical protein [Caudoviricetes sp.]
MSIRIFNQPTMEINLIKSFSTTVRSLKSFFIFSPSSFNGPHLTFYIYYTTKKCGCQAFLRKKLKK